MSIASELQILSGYVSALADDMDDIITALEDKGITATGHNFSDFANDIDSIQTGGITTEALTITENGTYTAPSGKAYTPITVDVGSVIPSNLPKDGKMRIGIKIPENAQANGKTVFLYYTHKDSGTATTIDWGDNTTPASFTGSGEKEASHTYTSIDSYIIVITITSGQIQIGASSSKTIHKAISGAQSYLRPYIQWVVLGTGVYKLGAYAFQCCTQLKAIRFPSSGFTEISGGYNFQYCISLEEINIPDTLTSLSGASTFAYCAALKKVECPQGIRLTANEVVRGCSSLLKYSSGGSGSLNSSICRDAWNLKEIDISGATSIGQYDFYNCFSLSYVEIPEGVTSIAGSSFYSCYSLQKIRFKPASPPSVANSSAFTNLPAGCIISVPTGKLSAYTSAANYPSSSTYTYIEE